MTSTDVTTLRRLDQLVATLADFGDYLRERSSLGLVDPACEPSADALARDARQLEAFAADSLLAALQVQRSLVSRELIAAP